MKTTAEFFDTLLKFRKHASILAIVHSVPQQLYEHEGDLAVVTVEASCPRLRSPNVHFTRAALPCDITRAVATIRGGRGGRPFELIYVKHDHRLASLAEQINAALSVAAPETLFLFEDAVPPALAMAGAHPPKGGGWYVGEVWMLIHLLRSKHDCFFAATINLLPTGLMVAAGFGPIEYVDFPIKYSELVSQVTNDEELRSISSHVTVDEALEQCTSLLRIGAHRSTIRVKAGLNIAPDVISRVVDLQITWRKPEPRFVLDLSGSDVNFGPLHEHERKVHGNYVDTFSDVYLIGSDTILKEETRFYCRGRDFADRILMERASGFGTAENHNTGFHLQGDEVVLRRDRLSFPQRIDCPVLLGTPDEHNNWGMWLFLTIPSVVEFQENGRGRYDKFLCYIQQPWQRAVLETLGLRPNEILSHNIDTVYQCSRITQIRHSWRDLVVTGRDKATFQKLSSEFGGKVTVPGHDRIFISRITRTRKDGSYRALLNEEELIDGLEPLGFQVVEPEYMTFAEQVATFASASVVVGLGGAAMFNTVFCKPGTRIIDIESGPLYLNAHTNIFASMDLEYGVIVGKQDSSDPRRNQKRWSLEVRPAIDRITAFLAGPEL